jgi:FAD/FMN-containing dehydrogenase
VRPATTDEVACVLRACAASAVAVVPRGGNTGLVGGAVPDHFAVMGYQDRGLDDWRRTTAPAILEHLRAQEADGLVLAPA